MKFHYIYRITNIPHKKHYYGVRTCHNKLPSEDLGYKYFSSSGDKKFIDDQKENPQNYKYKVVFIFHSREEALLMEIKLHNRFEVASNEAFYNKAKQTSIGFDTTGVTLSEEHKKKCSMPNIGKKRTAEQKKKISDALKGKPKSKEHRKNLSDANKGLKMKETTKNKISKSLKEKHIMGSIRTTSKEIEIFDGSDNPVYISLNNFKDFCEVNELPFKVLKHSYQNNGSRLYQTKMAKTKAINNGREQYIGWYAKIKE